MFCTKCGYKLSNGITVCPKCGNVISVSGGQDSFKNVDDQKRDRNEYMRQFGDMPANLDGVGVDMGDDRMGETIELRFDANTLKQASSDALDVTSVIRAEDAVKAEEKKAAEQKIMDQSAPAGGQGTAAAGPVQGIPTSAPQGTAGQYVPPIASHNIPGVTPPQNTAVNNTQNPLKQEIKYGEKVKKISKNKKSWIVACVFAALAIAAVIIVSVMINNDKNAGKKGTAGDGRAWGEGFTEKHILKHVDAVVPTLNIAGKGEYWHCEYCGKDFSDMAGEHEVDTDTLTTYLFDKDFKGVKEYEGTLYVIKDGVVDASFSGVSKYNDQAYCFKNGIQDDEFTGLTRIDDVLTYIKNGKSDNTVKGFKKFENEYYYVKDGVVDETREAVIKGKIKNDTEYWYVKNGKVTYVDTVAEYNNNWYYIKNGKIEKVDAIGQNENGKWYCKKGKVDFKFSGSVEFDGIVYEVKEGKVVSEHKAEEPTTEKDKEKDK